jgi:hypothetical protein
MSVASSQIRPHISRLSVALGFFSWLFFTPVAKADGSDVVVDMSGGVPDRGLPFGDPFTIKVPVEKTSSQTFGVFFEYAHSVWGIGQSEERCSEIADHLLLDSTALQAYRAGVTTLGKLFHAKPGQTADVRSPAPRLAEDVAGKPALALSPWRRAAPAEGAEADTSATLKVPGIKFFQPGARYCFVAFQAFDVEKTVLPELEQFAELVTTCSDNACTQQVLASVDQHDKDPRVTDSERKAIAVGFGAVTNFKEKLLDLSQTLGEIHDHGEWLKPGALGPITIDNGELVAWSSIEMPELDKLGNGAAGKRTVELTDGLFAALVERGIYSKKEPGYVAKDGEAIVALRVSDGVVHARHKAAKDKGYQDVALDLDLTKVDALPGVSFADLIALGTPAIPGSDGSPLTMTDLRARVEELTAKDTSGLPALESSGKRLLKLRAELNKSPSPGSTRQRRVSGSFCSGSRSRGNLRHSPT